MWGGSRTVVGMAANPFGAHQADRYQIGRTPIVIDGGFDAAGSALQPILRLSGLAVVRDRSVAKPASKFDVPAS